MNVYRNGLLKRRFVLEKEIVRIGRDLTSELTLDGEAVSRTHALIKRVSDGYMLFDESTNGTFLNGKKIRRSKLNKNDAIIIDEWRLVFVADNGVRKPDPTVVRENFTPKILSYRTEENTLVLQKPVLKIYSSCCKRPKVYEIKSKITKIGIANDNDVVLDDEYVSGYHARIAVYNDLFFLENLDFTNGTCVDGIYQDRYELSNGSTLDIGETIIRFEISSTKTKVEPLESDSFQGIISKDIKMKQIFSMMQIVAAKDNIVCIIGESGTGKDLVARAIHEMSPRRDRGKFISVNCGAIPKNLIESELFGHEKGSFTGAIERRIGAFEEASGGTIFLDEIGELEHSLQAKLLRVIQNNSIKRIGKNEEMPIDTRIVAATNKDLIEEIRKGNFREDLFFRLYVIPLVIPPLRDKKGDIPLLMDFFLKINSENGKRFRFSEDAYKKAINYDWPGNVRELENTIIRAITFCVSELIEARHLEFISFESKGINEKPITLAEIEQRELLKALKAANNNKAEAARILGLNRHTFSAKLRKHGLFNKS